MSAALFFLMSGVDRLLEFNTTFKFDPSHINSHDARASSSTHIDRDLLQQLLRAQDLIALHCKQQYASTFEHGSHYSRIDYVLFDNIRFNFDACNPPWIEFYAQLWLPWTSPLSIILCPAQVVCASETSAPT